MSFRYMGVFSVMVVLSMLPRLQRGCGSSCRCLRYAAYTHELKQALCHRRAEGTHFFIVPCSGTLTCLIYDTYAMSNGLPWLACQGLCRGHTVEGFWERGRGCRCTTTPVGLPTCDQYRAMALDASVGRDIQGQRRCRFPTTQHRLAQASPRGLALSTSGGHAGAEASCRSSATTYGHGLADICHKV